MAECKDCLHYEVCDRSSRKMWAAMEGKAECDDFADRSRYVEREKGAWATETEDAYWGNSLKRKYCTRCRKRPHFDRETGKFILTDFCPNCGSDMRGEQ